MSYFAELDTDNKVVNVILLNESVENVTDFLFQLYNHKRWKQTFIGQENTTKNFAGIGDFYDLERDAFITPKPVGCDSFILNEDTCIFEPPIQKPILGNKVFFWRESTLSWVEDTRCFISETGVIQWL